MKEFEFVKKLSALFGGGESGIGDDAVLVGDLLIAKDVLVENVHFLPSTPLNHVINKLFTANASDIAAMGGVPKYALLGIATPDMSKLGEMAGYIKSAADTYNMNVIGGDTSASKCGLFLSLTVIGTRGANILTRGGANAGDVIFISRPLGGAKLSLENELAGIRDYKHYEQIAEVELGAFLGGYAGITAVADISDGLGRDLSNIANASSCMAVLDYEKLDAASVGGAENAVSSGEEYGLVFTASPEIADALVRDINASLRRDIYRVGTMKDGGGTFIINGGQVTDISNAGYEHE